MAALPATSRSEARALGLSRYFTGKPCKYGHVVERYASYGACTACAYALAMGYRADNPEWWREYMARWRAENPGKHLEYYHNDPERYRARRRRRYQAEPEQERTRNRRYKRENPAANVARENRRRARKRNAPGVHTAEDVQRLYEAQHWVCAACPAALADGYHVDHIMPLALGGSNGPENLQLLCPPCNLSKGAKHPEEWKPKVARG